MAATHAQPVVLQDPIKAAQISAAQHATPPAGVGSVAVSTFDDPIRAAQVLAAAETTFPNLAADLENAILLRGAVADPTLRGNLRGRVAEEDWINRNAKEGWKAVEKRNAPQNDAWRRVDGRLEGAQVKVHADWHDYIRSMQNDNKAERFVLPDDHFDLVYRELETRRVGALRGGLRDKALEYAIEQKRLTKMGRTFSEVDGAIETAAKHYGRIAKALRAGGKAASFVGIGLALLDGGMAVYEVAVGKADVDELVTRLGKTVVGGAAAWAVGEVAVDAAVAAGASGAVPIAVVIVVGTATYLVVDWVIDKVVDSMRVSHLSVDDIKRVFPKGVRGIPLDRLYRKPEDPAALTPSSSGASTAAGGVVSAGTGAGLVAGTTAVALVAAYGTASTGTAIASLSGASATSATLAYMGGGSVAAGGFGMAGGRVLLGPGVGIGVVGVGVMVAFNCHEDKQEAERSRLTIDDLKRRDSCPMQVVEHSYEYRQTGTLL